MNNDISLIIPIKGREEFTFRILYYLYSIRFPYKIFISDGSINKSENKKIISSFKSKLNIEYLNFSYDKDFRSFLKKMYETLKLIKSKRVLLLPNDDFVNLDFLKQIISQNNNDTICGLNFDFKINNFFKFINDFGRVKFSKKINNEYNQNLCDKNNLERIKYIKKFHPFESIHLRDNLIKVFQMSLEFNVNNHKEFMWFLLLVPLYYNRVSFIKKGLLARQTNTYLSEGNNLHLKENFSSSERFEEFKNFVSFKFEDKKIIPLINNESFSIIPKMTRLRKVTIYLIYIKQFFSKYILNLYFAKKYNPEHYKKLYNTVNKNFKIND